MLKLDDTVFPTRLACFNEPSNACPVTPSMLTFLNITTKADYVQAYCLNPAGDSCPFGYCANPDIAGPSIRVSTYIVNVCSAIILLYSPEEIMGAFYSQLLTVYSFMITVMIAIQQRQITRLHATFAQFTVASPLSLYIVVYALRSTWANENHRNHRLALAVGHGRLLNRALVLLMVPIWVLLTVFLSFSSQGYRFSQQACDWRRSQSGLAFFYFNPFAIGSGAWWVLIVVASPLVVLAVMWAVCLWLQRKIIWKRNRRHRVPLGRMWRKVNDNYPFLRFYTIVLLPFAIWCTSLELGTRPADEVFQVTFGQVLPLFVALPPLISVCGLLSRLPPWFWDLTWVRFITGRRPPATRAGAERPGSEYSTTSTMEALYDDRDAAFSASTLYDVPYDMQYDVDEKNAVIPAFRTVSMSPSGHHDYQKVYIAGAM